MATRASNTVSSFRQTAPAFVTANASFDKANAAFASANNVAPQVQPAFDKANAAFAAANNVAPQVQPAYDTANAAFVKANSAFGSANSAVNYGANNTSNTFLSLPVGNTAERPSNVGLGYLRYNTDINGLEVYTASTGWQPLAAPPVIATVAPAVFSGELGTEFTIIGTNFTFDAAVYFITANGTLLTAQTVTFINSSQIRATTPRNVTIDEEPLDVRIVQASGSTTKFDVIDAGSTPTWNTAAGVIGATSGANTANVYLDAYDPEGTSVTYSLVSGSLPGGLNLRSNGLIQGVATSVLANTTYNFTIKASDSVGNNTDRSFGYTTVNREPVINTAAGSLGTFFSGNAVSPTIIDAYDPDGGTLTYAVTIGALPPNTSINSANGYISGTPIVFRTNTTNTFTVTTTDQGSRTISKQFTYTILNRPPVINTASGSLGSMFNANTVPNITIDAFDPDGGTLTFDISSGSLPANTTIGSANGIIFATSQSNVSSDTTFNFDVRATDVGGDSTSRAYSYTVLKRLPNWVTASGQIGTSVARGSAFNQTVSATDPDGQSITYSVVSGSLPTGLSLNASTGNISGTYSLSVEPTGGTTTWSFTLRATNSGGKSVDRAFSIATSEPYAGTSTFTYTGANQTFTVPAGVGWIQAKLWGAGGRSRGCSGGVGGFTEAKVTVTGGEVLTVIVGQSGRTADAGTAFGGGGAAGNDGGNGGAGGGGRSAIMANSIDILTAGGGGGSGGQGCNAGGGGGGLTGVGPVPGPGGGTQTSGGAGTCGPGGCGGTGTQFSGGNGTGGWAGGGGGGGWWGGGAAGGGTGSHWGGGGGSGFVGRSGSTALSGDTRGTSSTYDDTGGRTDSVNGRTYKNTKSLRGGSGATAAYSDADGNTGMQNTDGRVVIRW